MARQENRSAWSDSADFYDTEAMYELLFSPLVAGVSYGSIAFLNPVAGEFWYELNLDARAALPGAAEGI